MKASSFFQTAQGETGSGLSDPWDFAKFVGQKCLITTGAGDGNFQQIIVFSGC